MMSRIGTESMTHRKHKETTNNYMRKNEEDTRTVTIFSMSYRTQKEMMGKNKEDTSSAVRIFIQLLYWVSGIIFSCIAAYWIIRVISTYESEPVRSTVTMVRNTSFSWPAITFCPPKARNCPPPGRDEVLTMYNISVTRNTLNLSTFDWTQYSISSVLQQGRYNNVSSLINSCQYHQNMGSAASASRSSCMLEETVNATGSWSSYETMNGRCHTFTPTPATSILDHIYIKVNWLNCGRSHGRRYPDIGLHPKADKFYGRSSPFNRVVTPKAAHKVYSIYLGVEEFFYVNRKGTVCIEDESYSQEECFDRIEREFIIGAAGCYVAGFTGDALMNLYPECRSTQPYNNFTRIMNNASSNAEIQIRKKKQCLPPCHVTLYNIKSKTTNIYAQEANINLRLTESSMYYLQVKEDLAMSMDDLVANIGGTVGIFLGASCFTVISAMEYIFKAFVRNANNICKKYL